MCDIVIYQTHTHTHLVTEMTNMYFSNKLGPYPLFPAEGSPNPWNFLSNKSNNMWSLVLTSRKCFRIRKVK